MITLRLNEDKTTEVKNSQDSMTERKPSPRSGILLKVLKLRHLY